jgi:hypothetical protein
MTSEDVFEAHKLCAEAKSKIKVGGTAYVKIQQLMIKKQPNAVSDALGAALLGEQVTWLGAAAENTVFHKVRFTVTHQRVQHNPPIGTVIEGYVYGGNLSVCKPQMEPVSNDPAKKINPQAFFSTGGIKA